MREEEEQAKEVKTHPRTRPNRGGNRGHGGLRRGVGTHPLSHTLPQRNRLTQTQRETTHKHARKEGGARGRRPL